jgi:ribosomal protein L29
MKSSKMKEYTNMTVEELQKELKELKQELFKLRFQHALNGLDNPKKMSLVKKNIARVNTAITMKKGN